MGNAVQTLRTLRLERLCRAFGAITALRDLTLTVERGEFIALLGPSGCGKSTVLNCIAGLLPLSAGTIWLDDRRIDTLEPEDRNFGMVFQNYALFPHLTVRRNIAFGLETRRRTRADITRRVDDVLALVRLTEHAEKRPWQLSGGQQQRVAIARAIVLEPALVLMDEPLSNLDAKLRLEMRAEIRRIHNLLGAATIHVTHDHQEALSLADRIVVLGDGAVRQIGTPEDLYTRPANPEVAEFMGYRNMVRSNTEMLDGGVAIRVGGARLFGTPVGMPGDAVIAAIRPEDLVPAEDGTVAATVESVEYHGREFFGTARTADRTRLYFCSAGRIAPGEQVRLGANAARVLLFPAGAG
jgi:putative spermidine/putrescine transport system ATP-binding protein